VNGLCPVHYCYGQETAEMPTEVAFPHGSISGVVTDAKSNKPIRDAKVEVTKNGFSFGVSAKTGDDGKYTIENAPVGVFDLSISKVKYLSKVVSDISVKQGDITANVNIAISLITPIQVGDEARDFSLPTIKGKLVTLSDFFGKKLVVFSISNRPNYWGGDYAKHFPHLERIYQHYHQKDVAVMAIISGVTDEYYRRERLPRFYQDYKVSYTVLDDQKNSLTNLYVLSANMRAPQVLIVDKEGIVRYVGESTPWMEMAEEIERLLGRTEEFDLSTVELAVQSLKNSDGYVRWKAAEALGWLGDEEVVPALIEALGDEVGGVRELAAKALGEIGDSKAMEPLAAALEDKSNLVRLEAVKALEWMADEQIISQLTKSLKDSELRQTAANALARIGKPELVSKALKEHRAILQRGGTREFAEEYAHLGRAYKEAGMYDAAIDAYENAAKLSPDSYRRKDYTRYLVECYMEAGEKEKAATAYLQMIKSASASGSTVSTSNSDGTVEMFSEREWAIRRFVDSLSRQGRLFELAELLEAKLSESPEDVGLYETLGKIYDKEKMNEEAISMYEKVAELQPHNVKSRALLALAYKRAGMLDKAIATAKEIAKKGGDASTRSAVAKVFLACGLYDEAAAEYKKAVSMTNSDWERRGYQFGLANSYDKAGKYAEAATEYENIAKSSTSSHYRDIAETNLWKVYKRGNLYDVAIEKYQKMVEVNQKDVRAHESLAKAYRRKGELKKAIAEYEEITKLKPDDAKSFENLGDIYKEQGNFEKAATAYEQAINLAPDKNNLHVKLGDCYREQGMLDDAIAEYDISKTRLIAEIESGSIDSSVYNQLARFYIKKNIKTKETISLAQQAAELGADELMLWDMLGQAYWNDGQKEKARQEWAKTGFVRDTDWLVIGPFDNTDGAGFSKAYPPEEQIDRRATYKGQLSRTLAKDDFTDAHINLYKIFDDNQWKVAYALAHATSPTEREALLGVGSDDDVKVWLNGEEVLSHIVARSVAIDQDIIPVTLKSGANEILVKVCNRTGDWGFYLRITDMEGNPYVDLKFVPASELKIED